MCNAEGTAWSACEAGKAREGSVRHREEAGSIANWEQLSPGLMTVGTALTVVGGGVMIVGLVASLSSQSDSGKSGGGAAFVGGAVALVVGVVVHYVGSTYHSTLVLPSNDGGGKRVTFTGTGIHATF